MRTDVVILAGGRGVRFWPLSRNSRPKQVLRLVGDESLLRATVRRALHGDPGRGVWAVAGQDQEEVLVPEAPGVDRSRWVWEPVGRNTAPAVVAATVAVLEEARRMGEEDRRVLVLSADHHVPDSEAFWESARLAERIVDETGRLVTFGIEVTRPETGYGYIERGNALFPGAFEVSRFHEKPDEAKAREYQAAGGFYWNAGIFLFSAQAMLDEVRTHAPELFALVERAQSAFESVEPTEPTDPAAPSVSSYGTEGGSALSPTDSRIWDPFFHDAPSSPIDRAIMEKSERVAVVEAGFAWDDLGGWLSWGDFADSDSAGNRIQGDVLAVDSRDNIVLSADGGTTAILGVEGLVVVRVGDATLVCPKDRLQEIRRIVEKGREEWPERF